MVNGHTSALVTPVTAVVTLASGSGDISGAVFATPVGNSAYVVAGQTLSPGGSVIIAGDTTYSLASNVAVGSGGGAIVIDGITSSLPAATGAADGILATPVGSSGEYMIAGQTLSPGGSALIAAGITYSLVSDANGVVVVNGMTSTLSATATIAGADTGVLATPIGSSGEYVIAGQTLSPDGSAIVVSGTTYSLAHDSAFSEVVVVNRVTSPLPTAVATAIANPTATAETDYILAGQTLVPGAPAITISGTTISLAAGGSTVYVNGIASILPTPGSGTLEIAGIEATAITIPSAQTVAGQGEIIVDGTTYALTPTLVSGTTEVVIGSQTLSPNAIITVGDATLSLAAGGTGVLVAEGGVTRTAEGGGVAGAIMSVLEAGDSATTTVYGTGTMTGTVTVVKTSTTTSGSGTGSQATTSPSPSTSALLLSTKGPSSEGTRTSSSKGAAAVGGMEKGRGGLGHGVVGGLIGIAMGFVAFL